MPTLTLQDLSNRIYARLDNNSQLYTQTEVTNAANESIRVLNLLTGFLSSTVQVTTVANRHFYDVPSPILLVTRVQFENSYLQPYGSNELGRAYPSWTIDTTLSTAMPVTNWIPI